MRCEKCGYELGPKDKRCPNCNHPVKRATDQPSLFTSIFRTKDKIELYLSVIVAVIMILAIKVFFL